MLDSIIVGMLTGSIFFFLLCFLYWYFLGRHKVKDLKRPYTDYELKHKVNSPKNLNRKNI